MNPTQRYCASSGVSEASLCLALSFGLGEQRLDGTFRRFQGAFHPAMTVRAMLAGKVDAALRLNDVPVDTRELAGLVERKCAAAPAVGIPRPATPIEDHIGFFQFGMNLRHLPDHKVLAFARGHRAEPTGVLPPRVASDENPGPVRYSRIPRLGAVLIQCVVGRIDDRARHQIGSARASIDAVALFPEPVLRLQRDLCAGIVPDLDDRTLLLV